MLTIMKTICGTLPNVPIRNFNKSWCRYLETILQPYAQVNSPNKDKILEIIDVPYQRTLPIKRFPSNEVRLKITKLRNTKTPRCDRIDFKLIKVLTEHLYIIASKSCSKLAEMCQNCHDTKTIVYASKFVVNFFKNV